MICTACMLVASSPQIGLLALLLVVAGTLWLRSRHRSRPMIESARRLGMTYSRMHHEAAPQRCAGLAVLQVGHSQRAVDVLTGESPEGPLTSFRLITELGSRSSRRVVHMLVAVIETRTDIRSLHMGHRPIDEQLVDAETLIETPSRGDQSLYLYASKADGPHLAAGPVVDWLAGQPAEFYWQVLPTCVAGYCHYTRDPDHVTRLIAAARDLARLLAR